MMKADYHVHTAYSDDSDYAMEACIKDAISLKLDEVAITDHVDYGIKEDWDFQNKIKYRQGMALANVDYPKWYQELCFLQQKYDDQIKIKAGMEFGMQLHTIDRFQLLYERYPFDFIILSIHQIDDQEFWTQDFQRGKSQKEYNERYYQEMLDIITQYKNYSVLGHMDLLTRYDLQGPYPFTMVKVLIEKILKTVIQDGKGIEVNTSYHRYGLHDMTPSRDILKLYKQLGGKIITIGSDCHQAQHLGAYIDEVKEELRKIGFEYFCTFEKMQPVYHRL